jgi:hypothetical protein
VQKILQAHDDDGWLAATVDLFAGSDAGSHRAAAMYSLTKPPSSMASTRSALLPTFPPALLTIRLGKSLRVRHEISA